MWLENIKIKRKARKIKAENRRLKSSNKHLLTQLQSMIDQTIPLVPVEGDPRWSRRITIDELMFERDRLKIKLEAAKLLLKECSEVIQESSTLAKLQAFMQSEEPDADAKNQSQATEIKNA